MKKLLVILIMMTSASALADCAPVEFAEANTYTKAELVQMAENSNTESLRILKQDSEAFLQSLRSGGPRPQKGSTVVCSNNRDLAFRLLTKKFPEGDQK